MKTLKDLPVIMMDEADPTVYVEDLRKEAIKWVKELRKPVHTSEDDYYYYGNRRAADKLQEFFNITEEDLKDENKEN